MTERRHPEAVWLELFTSRFTAIAAEMGELLRRTALSTNVKERLDFSCAVLDADGKLVVNAPHIPVHLGSLGMCVRRVAESVEMRPGDVFVTNHPGYGGSHLPDVTVITPVDVAGRRLGYVASRAHHAEIGGARPGSMPPRASSLAEEGVVIPPTLLLRARRPRWGAIRGLLSGGRYPSRTPEENIADLAAAVAANAYGAAALSRLAVEHGDGVVRRAMSAVERLAEAAMRRALARLPRGRHRAVEHLDDGTVLAVEIRLAGQRATVDFSGSGSVHPGNLNATPAIVASAVIYVLRLLIDEPLPLNEGLLAPVRLVVPEGILAPRFPADPELAPAVVGGNVETSQRLVDLMLKALQIAACSQGTMNNLLFGTDRFGYYETICGGAGATADGPGADAVHTHMTNTRITDPEVVEHRYPVRLVRFSIRRGSGGRGHHRGGDGAIRELEFLAPMDLSLLSQHRVVPPFGMAGGEAGTPGRQRLIRPSGETVELGGIDGCAVQPGDRLLLETPGGGGWGVPEEGP